MEGWEEDSDEWETDSEGEWATDEEAEWETDTDGEVADGAAAGTSGVPHGPTDVDAQGSEVSAAAPSQVRLPATVQAVAGSASRMAEGPGASRPGSRPGSPARPAALAVRARRGAGSGTGEAALYEAQSPVSGRTSFASASEQAGGSLRHERSSEGHSRLRRGSRVSGEGAAGSGAGMGGLVAEGSTTSLASAARRMRGRVAPGDGDVPEGRLSEIAGGTRLARSLGRDAGPAPLSPLAREASPPPMHTEGGHGIGGAGGRKPGRRPDASGEESGDDGAGGGGRRRRVVDPDTGKRKVLRRKKRAGEAFALKDDTVYRGLDGRPLRTNINVDLHYLDMPTAYGAPAPKKEEKKRKGEDKKKEDKGHGKGGKHRRGAACMTCTLLLICMARLHLLRLPYPQPVCLTHLPRPSPQRGSPDHHPGVRAGQGAHGHRGARRPPGAAAGRRVGAVGGVGRVGVGGRGRGGAGLQDARTGEGARSAHADGRRRGFHPPRPSRARRVPHGVQGRGAVDPVAAVRGGWQTKGARLVPRAHCHASVDTHPRLGSHVPCNPLIFRP